MITKSLITFKHSSIGTKVKPRTATAHMCYIMRQQAMTHFNAENMPDGGRGTRVFFDRLWEKAGMPDSARICDKLMIALPVELTPQQRHEVLEDFMEKLGKGRISWCAAHHDKGDDAHNPHAHVVFKDADIDTGRKVIGTTTSSRDVREAQEHGWKVPPRTTTADMRKMWCEHLNAFMARAGLDIRYDPRTLKEQGLFREAQIHIGPRAQALQEKGHDFTSQDRIRGERSIVYTLYDHDSRAAHNNRIIENNKAREVANDSSPKIEASRHDDKEMRELRERQDRERQAMYKEQQRDRDALRLAQNPARLDHQKWARKLYAEARQAAYRKVKEQYAEKWKDLRTIKDLEERRKSAEALILDQKKSYKDEATHQVKLCRPEKDAAWKVIYAQQDKERRDLRALHRQETTALARQHAAERLALKERRRAQSIEKQANIIDARYPERQDMAVQQHAALDAIGPYAKTQEPNATNSEHVPFANPCEAARTHSDMAFVEKSRHASIRQILTQGRASDLERAGPGGQKTYQLAHGQSISGPAALLRTGRASPRAIVAPGIHAARFKRGGAVQYHLPLDDQQNQIRQTAQSGRTLNDGERRANAPLDIKQRLSDHELKALAIRSLAGVSSGHEDLSKGRNRAGRER